MGPVALVPAVALGAGAACALVTDRVATAGWVLAALTLAGWISWRFHQRLTMLVLAAGFFCASAALGVGARSAALHTPLRAVLNREIGDFDLDTIGPGARHDPMRVRALLVEDASREAGFIALRARVTAIGTSGGWEPAEGGVTLAVGGTATHADTWRAGRTVETFATFRRPAQYLNDGVPDVERQLALDGTTLFGSVKSALLVDVVARGTPIEEAAAEVRQHARRSIERHVAPHGAVSAAIVAAVLIGDRTGLPDPIRLRLQAAGTYHVIAISGGNIAILAALVVLALRVFGISGRPTACLTLLLLGAYAQVVTTSPSVWRATLMAGLYFAARLAGHRSPPWQAVGMAAALVVCARPLEVRSAGFLLTFGATAALLETARRASAAGTRHRVAAWVLASISASLAVELVLLPVNASTFSRVTAAGLALNLAAVPLMGVVQIGGVLVAALDRVDLVAAPAGWVAHAAASALVASARLVEIAPWLVVRVPPPPAALIGAYYLGLGVALAGRGAVPLAGVTAVAAAAVAIVSGQPAGWLREDHAASILRVTAFDVGQGDATLVQLPGGSALLVDAGGLPFGGGSFDVGSRVLAPALWARGVRRLDALLLTHGDPDHVGGASAVVSDFVPARVWQGIPVPADASISAVLERARHVGARLERRQAGEEMAAGGARLRVLHPPPPDWERRRARNDDSVVLEVVYGDIAVLLPGDVGAAVERGVLARLTPARLRILKVAHHGSRTSTSRELVERWRPQIAIVSAGRGNPFGHPAPEVLERLAAIGAAIYRTDLDGQVTFETDGRDVRVRTYVERRRH
ncbi:MAG: DNA internalization-related competence protein ComEC/Rec2 [Acidobacteria bacterium RIFCSPLOWO2_02_FULL_68_18]|nr:MAG: DNA internalization-related competence protein ComEC/Rec2 [Acidobacteria bacterium RIFCSPLOWO2_02_FULL_68_18]OFW50019.1 MAG: DNA internalization-related competence protein ComEC/Rec2 [Acidobacteria bacterium RIFCSPLOWO2_12_FULL_68_19]